jgi:hypothetical protein
MHSAAHPRQDAQCTKVPRRQHAQARTQVAPAEGTKTTARRLPCKNTSPMTARGSLPAGSSPVLDRAVWWPRVGAAGVLKPGPRLGGVWVSAPVSTDRIGPAGPGRVGGSRRVGAARACVLEAAAPSFVPRSRPRAASPTLPEVWKSAPSWRRDGMIPESSAWALQATTASARVRRASMPAAHTGSAAQGPCVPKSRRGGHEPEWPTARVAGPGASNDEGWQGDRGDVGGKARKCGGYGIRVGEDALLRGPEGGGCRRQTAARCFLRASAPVSLPAPKQSARTSCPGGRANARPRLRVF